MIRTQDEMPLIQSLDSAIHHCSLQGDKTLREELGNYRETNMTGILLLLLLLVLMLFSFTFCSFGFEIQNHSPLKAALLVRT